MHQVKATGSWVKGDGVFLRFGGAWSKRAVIGSGPGVDENWGKGKLSRMMKIKGESPQAGKCKREGNRKKGAWVHREGQTEGGPASTDFPAARRGPFACRS